jgi:hypothetical protein
MVYRNWTETVGDKFRLEALSPHARLPPHFYRTHSSRSMTRITEKQWNTQSGFGEGEKVLKAPVFAWPAAPLSLARSPVCAWLAPASACLYSLPSPFPMCFSVVNNKYNNNVFGLERCDRKERKFCASQHRPEPSRLSTIKLSRLPSLPAYVY